MYTITMTGGEELKAKFESFGPKLKAELMVAMENIRKSLEDEVRQKLSGEVLDEDTGALLNSLTSDLSEGSNSIRVTVSAGDGVPYAAIQEYGGVIAHPGGTAIYGGKFISNAAAIAIEAVNGQSLYRTRPHSITLSEKSYMRSSLEESVTVITEELDAAIQRAIE